MQHSGRESSLFQAESVVADVEIMTGLHCDWIHLNFRNLGDYMGIYWRCNKLEYMQIHPRLNLGHFTIHTYLFQLSSSAHLHIELSLPYVL